MQVIRNQPPGVSYPHQPVNIICLPQHLVYYTPTYHQHWIARSRSFGKNSWLHTHTHTLSNGALLETGTAAGRPRRAEPGADYSHRTRSGFMCAPANESESPVLRACDCFCRSALRTYSNRSVCNKLWCKKLVKSEIHRVIPKSSWIYQHSILTRGVPINGPERLLSL